MSVPDLDRKDLARARLRSVREEYECATRNRIHCAQLARREGLTNEQIGMQLGLTESGVRRLIQRAASQMGGKA